MHGWVDEWCWYGIYLYREAGFTKRGIVIDHPAWIESRDW